ncbi:MAG: hypothetical protein H6930_04755 [Rhodoferax sp.]|nr:hypothetical protein [Rhodoferax sp.]
MRSRERRAWTHPPQFFCAHGHGKGTFTITLAIRAPYRRPQSPRALSRRKRVPPKTSTASSGIPLVALGTCRLNGDIVKLSVRQALAPGYRHIDTAQAYDNQADVGRASAG